MVTYQELRDAQPAMFATAADDWLKLAKEAEAAAEDIYETGGKELEENWQDALGERAKGHCRKLAQDFQGAGMAVRGVVTTLDGLADALEMAKRNLDSAVDFAAKAGLKVDSAGKVTVPPGVTDPQAAERAKQAGWLIWDAVNDATKIDNAAAASLRRLIKPASITEKMTPGELAETILDEPVKKAGHASLNMIKQTMPLNADAQTQAAWWNSLTPAQQKEYMRAAPVELYDMKGISEEVKQQLTGSGGLNRIEMIRWAEKYANTDHTDVPGMNNCTNFVSYAMHDGGGMNETDGWNANHTGAPELPFIGSPDTRLHSDAWAVAKNHHDYMLEHGGQTVSRADARPGDILYLKDETGNIHHTAVVTAVTPDGEIMYTQHNTNHANVGLSDRLPNSNMTSGNSDVPIIVRPHPNRS